jgi:tetratricopeptide (TPR) repeat protein
MRPLIWASFVVLIGAVTALGVVSWLVGRESGAGRRTTLRRPAAAPTASASASGAGAAEGGPAVIDDTTGRLDDGGVTTAARFMAPIRDPESLQELREAVRGRGRRGIAALRARHDGLRTEEPPTREQALELVALRRSLGLLYMYEGEFAEAAAWIERALVLGRARAAPPATRAGLTALMGIIALRRGEIENCLECLGPSSCIFPIAPEAVHRNQGGSREAVRWFTAYLEENPRDLRIAWLLNLAAMTLGEYPEAVPPRHRIPLEPFRSRLDVGRFENVAARAGLTARGPNQAGGSCFDDFTGDGRPDLFTTSLDADRGASLFVNRGDGTFEDRSLEAGLADQVYALNARHADFDNDGDLDVLLLRGGWESPMRLSLLSNRGDGTFADVTAASGLSRPIATEAAAWGDYDDDGHLDLFVCGEYLPPGAAASGAEGDPRNRCRLYRNRGDGTFVDVAAAAGVTNERCGKGAAWGDYDGDGRLDLFVSNMGRSCRLFHNEGGGTFRDVAPELGVVGPEFSFACWFWDYDNDGRPDLYVNDYRADVAEVLAGVLGASPTGARSPRLYRNLGPDGFRDVAAEVGLGRPMAPMGANFGDIDNDGDLDLYLGTGEMSYSGLDLNLLFKNVAGRRFEDVTLASGTGHLQKGHGVSFADWDDDGDLDLFVELGGAAPGDRSHNALFRNPGHGRHWLKVKLVGTTTNRSAIGAKIRVELRRPDGTARAIHRTVGNNSSFGGNSLVETIGVLDAARVAELTVSWPTSRTTQTFRDLAADQAIEITEGSASFRPLSRPAAATPHP